MGGASLSCCFFRKGHEQRAKVRACGNIRREKVIRKTMEGEKRRCEGKTPGKVLTDQNSEMEAGKNVLSRGPEATHMLGVHVCPHLFGQKECRAARGAASPCPIQGGSLLSQQQVRSDSNPFNPEGSDPSAHRTSPLPRLLDPQESHKTVSK